jgi:hypothetical protein
MNLTNLNLNNTKQQTNYQIWVKLPLHTMFQLGPQNEAGIGISPLSVIGPGEEQVPLLKISQTNGLYGVAGAGGTTIMGTPAKDKSTTSIKHLLAVTQLIIMLEFAAITTLLPLHAGEHVVFKSITRQ